MLNHVEPTPADFKDHFLTIIVRRFNEADFGGLFQTIIARRLKGRAGI